jgi:hypothetical protein
MKYFLGIIAFCSLFVINLKSETHKGKIYLNNGDIIKSKAILLQDSLVKYRLTNEPNTLVVSKSIYEK